VMGKAVVKNSSGNTEQAFVPRARHDRLVPDTYAYAHDGQRQVPRDRPDIRAQLTGSILTYVDQLFTKERQVVSITEKGSTIFPYQQTTISAPS